MTLPVSKITDEKIDLNEIFNPRSKISSLPTFAHVFWLNRRKLVISWLIFGLPLAAILAFHDFQNPYVARSYLHFPVVNGTEDDVIRDATLRDPGSIIPLFNSYNVISKTIKDKRLQFQVRTRKVFRGDIFGNIQYTDGASIGRYTFVFRRPRQFKIVFHDPKTGKNSVLFNDVMPQDGNVSIQGISLQINKPFLSTKKTFTVEADFLSPQEAFDDFRKRLAVNNLDSGDNAQKVNYSVALKDADPFMAADALNDLVQNFIATFKGATNDQDVSMVAHLQTSLETAREKAKDAQDKLAHFYTENPSLIEIQQSDSYAMVNAQTERSQFEVRLDNVHQLIDRIPKPENSNATKLAWVSDAVFLLDSYGVLQVNSLETHLKDLEAKKNELLAASWAPTHPKILALEAEMTSLQPDLLQLLIISQTVWGQKLEEIKEQVSKGLKKNVPIDIDLEAKRLTADNENAAKTVENLQFALDRASLSKEGKDFLKVNLVDSARTPEFQSSGSEERWVVSVAALFAGVIPGFVWIFCMQLFFGRIYTREDVERKLRKRFLSCFFSTPSEKPDAKIEGFHFARSEIEIFFPTASPFCVLVTSSRSGDGKSIFSTKIARSFGQRGKRTLLVDAGLRHDSAINPGETNPGTGPAEVFQKRPLPNQALNPDGMKAFLASVGRDFDVVVVDAPAVLASSNALELMKTIPNVAFIIKAGSTSSRDAEEALSRITARGVQVGCVLSAVKDSPFVKNHFAD